MDSECRMCSVSTDAEGAILPASYDQPADSAPWPVHAPLPQIEQEKNRLEAYEKFLTAKVGYKIGIA